jgi:hypothetical protein
VLAIAAWHLVSHPALISAPPTVQTKQNKVSILCFNWLNTILAMPRQKLLEMAAGDSDSDGYWRWQLWWSTVTETAMADGEDDGNGDGNGWWQRIRDGGGDGWRQPQRQWPTATAMGNGNGDGDGVSDDNGDGKAIAMLTAMVRVTMTNTGLPLHVLVMCSAMAGATPCLHPHGHKGKCIHQCCIMGVTLLRVFPPFQGGGGSWQLTWIVFCLLFTTTVQFTEQPSVPPPHYSGAQEPCQPTAHWCFTSSTPPRTPSAYWQSTPAPIALFAKVSLGRACNDYNLTFCVNVKWQISQQTSLFPKLLLCHWQITPLSFQKHPVVIVETFKVKVYLAVLRHFPAQPFCLVLMLAFAWQLFSSLHLRLAPFLGSSIALQLQY